MISSPSAQIVNAIAEKTFVTASNGDRVEAYGPVMGIATVIIALGIAVTTALGPEKRGARFEIAKIAGEQQMDMTHKLDDPELAMHIDEKGSVPAEHLEKVDNVQEKKG